MALNNSFMLVGNVSNLSSERFSDGKAIYRIRLAVPDLETGKTDFINLIAFGLSFYDPWKSLKEHDDCLIVGEIRDKGVYNEVGYTVEEMEDGASDNTLYVGVSLSPAPTSQASAEWKKVLKVIAKMSE